MRRCQIADKLRLAAGGPATSAGVVDSVLATLHNNFRLS